MNSLTICTYYEDVIIVRGNYTQSKPSLGRENPPVPSSFEVIEIFGVNDKSADIDRFIIEPINEICCDMIESEMTKIHLTRKMSESIMNTNKYLSYEEQCMLECILQKENRRAGNSQEKKAMIKEIARKCILSGLSQEFIETLN